MFCVGVRDGGVMRKSNLLTALVSSIAICAGAVPVAATTTINGINQTATSTKGVFNAGIIIVGTLSGDGTSATISASGAVATVSVLGIGASALDIVGDVDIDSLGVGNAITQLSTHNTSDIVENIGEFGKSGLSFGGEIGGLGALVSISSSGAAALVSASYIKSSGQVSIGAISQTAQTLGSGDVTNHGAVYLDGPISGSGAGVSISATGAASSVSLSGIRFTQLAATIVGDISQTTSNSAHTSVRNEGFLDQVDADSWVAITGAGASFSAAASGAISSVSLSQIRPLSEITTVVGNVTQNTANNGGDNYVENFGGSSGELVIKKISGAGASASISAVGAGSFVAANYILSNYGTSTQIGDISQTTTNGAELVKNTGMLTGYNFGAKLEGAGASISINAVGAVSAVAASYIASMPQYSLVIGNVTQYTENNADVTNIQYGYYKPGTGAHTAKLNLLSITGDGASANIAAQGAASTVAVTTINGSAANHTAVTNIGAINQTTINSGTIQNYGVDGNGAGKPYRNEINVGHITGVGASVSIAATGAASTVSVATINSQSVQTTTNIGAITQSSINSGGVINRGTARIGSLSGAGTSVSISATGAAAAVSLSSIR